MRTKCGRRQMNTPQARPLFSQNNAAILSYNLRKACGESTHELKAWPQLHWSSEAIAEPLASVRHRQGRLIGRMEALGFNLQQEAVLETLTSDVLKAARSKARN